MSDLIERQAAIDALNHEYRCGDIISQCGIEVAIDIISELPTIQPVATDTNVGDIISRLAAIDAVALSAAEWDGMYVQDINGRIRKALEKLPSAQPEQRWIPCSERLPKKDGRYQVTRYDYVANTEFIDILWYEENLWWNRHSTGDYAVTAWMPLPEPYKEGGADVQ